MASQFLGLSLFVMLLAFFIVLNSISSFEEEKINPVIKSVGSAFSSEVLQDKTENQPFLTQGQDTLAKEGSTLDRMKALFSSRIPGYEAVINHRKGILYLQIPFEAFEAAALALQVPDAGQENPGNFDRFFLPALVALMKTEINGDPYRMDMVLNIAENPAAVQNRQPQQLSALMKRMGRIAGEIEAAGLPAKLVSTGMQKGNEGMIELFFRPHIPFNPLGPDANEQQQ